ncbi:MAG: class I SAM-dependent methyltransferase [Deltaproteobacteria bacterium]|nr:class I SAM-dependent methyltransferase [Deltaproteobacteria bacterium]
MAPREDALFSWIERVHGKSWGSVLDSGTGEHSLRWLASLSPASLTAVTVEAWRLPGLGALATPARVVEGQWTDPRLLAGDRFDVVVADYVIGAIDGHAPYFQYGFLDRIRPHVGSRLYLVGMEPPPRDGSALDEVCRCRDAAILLAGHRTYREYPRDLVVDWLGRAGYRVIDAASFPNVLAERFVNGQLDVARRKLPYFESPALAESFAAYIEEVRRRALATVPRGWGSDWVIAAGV